MELKSLHNKAKWYWFVRNMFWLLLICVPYVLGCVFTEGTVRTAVLISGGILVVIFATLLCLFPFLKYRFYKYGYDEKRILINCGVIFRHRIVIPMCQMQDLHIVEGPLTMAFKLRGIIFSTAGSNFILPCIEKNDAEKIVSEVEGFLQERIKVLEDEEV